MQYQQPKPFRRATLLFLAALLLLASAAAAGGRISRPAITLSNGRQSISSLFIGSHLAAGLTGVQPYESYVFVLRNANAAIIASAGAKADATGTVQVTPLWAYTGVVGCDSGASPDSSLSRFTSFAEADDALAGTTLQLTALDADGAVVVTQPVPILSAVAEVPYFSEADGCRRSDFVNDEHVYLSYYNANHGLEHRAIFLVRQKPGGFAIGDPLNDVRPSRPPQLFTLPEFGNVVTVMIWAADDTEPGVYGGVSRIYTPDDTAPPAVVLEGDVMVELFSGVTTTGLNISVNGCSCIDPPG